MASAIVLARVRSLAPEFASLTDAQIGERADAAGPYISTRVYSVSVFTGQTAGGGLVSIYAEATALWTCHQLTRIPVAAYDSGGAGGGSAILVTSDTTGDLSQTYAMPQGLLLSASDMDYATTHYGLNLIRLRSTRAKAAVPLVV
jgi:hypothetical protein